MHATETLASNHRRNHRSLNTRLRLACGVVLALTGCGVAAAQQSGAPPRPSRDPAATAAPQRVATGRLAGRVLAGDTRRPLRRAIVQLGTGNLQTTRWTATDSDGRWAFTGVDAGTYTITASRDGFVTMSHGQKGPFGAASPVVLSADQGRDSLDILLPPGGVITGRLVDDLGDPVGAALVQPMRLTFVDGQRQLVTVASGLQSLSYGGLTDDRGEFRIYGLAPGTYYVSAAYGRTAPGQSDDRVSYATTYYPGTASIAGASPLTVVAGQAVAANFALSATPLVEVSGRVLNASNPPTAGNVTLVAVAPGHAVEAGTRLSGQVDRNGAFRLKGVPPGEYYLRASAGTSGGAPAVGALLLVVADRDVRDVVVTTAPMSSVSGALALDEPSRDVRPDMFFVEAVAAGPDAMRAGPAMPQGRPNTEGRFTITGISGRHVIRLRNPPAGWFLKSVSIDGADVTDAGYDFAGGQTVVVDVVATRRMAGLSGTVRDAKGLPLSDCSVVVFSPDESQWGRRTRVIAATTPGQDGTFSVSGLPPGEYVAVAVPTLEEGEEGDPARLLRWRATGRRVTLLAAQSPSIVLTVEP